MNERAIIVLKTGQRDAQHYLSAPMSWPQVNSLFFNKDCLCILHGHFKKISNISVWWGLSSELANPTFCTSGPHQSFNTSASLNLWRSHLFKQHHSPLPVCALTDQSMEDHAAHSWELPKLSQYNRHSRKILVDRMINCCDKNVATDKKQRLQIVRPYILERSYNSSIWFPHWGLNRLFFMFYKLPRDGNTH